MKILSPSQKSKQKVLRFKKKSIKERNFDEIVFYFYDPEDEEHQQLEDYTAFTLKELNIFTRIANPTVRIRKHSYSIAFLFHLLTYGWELHDDPPPEAMFSKSQWDSFSPPYSLNMIPSLSDMLDVTLCAYPAIGHITYSEKDISVMIDWNRYVLTFIQNFKSALADARLGSKSATQNAISAIRQYPLTVLDILVKYESFDLVCLFDEQGN